MKKWLPLVVGAALGLPCATVSAETRTVKLEISRMACPACPLTVKKALKKVDGVLQAEVSFEKKEATVVFDDAKANVDQLLKATANAGFPAKKKDS